MRWAWAALLIAGCGSGERTFEAPLTLGGREVAPEVLNTGEFVYMRHCRGCHGQRGRGDGPYASTMERPPADLTRGEYRHLEGAPPSDAAIAAVIREGIEGTPMGPQQVSGDQLDAVVQYVRYLAEASPDPAQRVQ